MDDWRPPEGLRLGKKTDKTGIGKRRDPEQPRKKIQLVSHKQRVRTNALKDKFKLVLMVQKAIYKYNFCVKCGSRKDLLADHVETRNEKNPDRFGNLQPLCFRCNSDKGSVRADYRDFEFVEALDKMDGEKCT